MIDISYKDLIAPAFYRLWNDVVLKRYPEIWLAGGRGSTKSSFVSTAIVILMEMNPRLHCVCFRKFGTNLADSVYTQFEFTINQKLTPIAHHWKFCKSPLKIVNVNTGQQILFRGLDDPQKVKSLKAPFGYFGLTWFEELAEFDCIEEVRNVNQSLHRGGHYFQTFCSYNPPETTANWVNAESAIPQIVDGKLYRLVHRSDYRTVPVDWLGKNFFIEAELLKNTNLRAYEHEYLGKVTGNGGAIFPNVHALTMTDEMIRGFEHRRFGVDFGFAIDPACWLAMEFNSKYKDLYLYDEIYDTGMTNITFANLIKQKDMGFEYLMCDSAEPKSIAEFESFGINALAAQKGPDSVRYSTKYLQGLRNIFIDPNRCPNAYREFTQYEYEKNKSGLFISRYPDKNNHSIDSCLVGPTKVWTPDGLVQIQDLVGKTGTTYGYDEERGIVVPTKFINVRKTREDAEVIRLVLEDDYVTCTSDHRILTVDGYKEAGELKPGDVVRGAERNSPVKGIVHIFGRHDVYDLEVPETHNFAIGNGMFVHNCRYAMMEEAIQAGIF